MRSVASLSLPALLAASLARAHGDHAEVDSNPDATYAELHMAQEHHMDSFDIQAFFHLHDLNRDGILDRNELESIYGVHHEKKRKGTKSLEVHTAQAREIVDAVLERLDANRDGVLTMREFVAGGVGGLPNFKGVEHLGHHYDAEGEYFLHHEEQYHSTPETQTEESYIHPEDIEHFMSHEQIEDVEEERVRHFTGEESDLPEAGTAEAAKLTPEQVAQHVFNELNGISDEASTPEEERFIKQVEKDEDRNAAKPQIIEPKHVDVPPPVYNPAGAPPPPPNYAAMREAPQGQQPLGGGAPGGGEPQRTRQVPYSRSEAYLVEEKARQSRAAAARAQAEKFGKNAREAAKRGGWGEAVDAAGRMFASPKDAADKLRRNVPFKYKMRKSWFGEFWCRPLLMELTRSYGASFSTSTSFVLKHTSGNDLREWGGKWECAIERMEGTDKERPDSFVLRWSGTKNLAAELFSIEMHSQHQQYKSVRWCFPITRALEGSEGSVDFRGLIPSRLWSSKATPPTSITFYIRDSKVELPKLANLTDPADLLDTHSRNNVAFVFPASNKVLWANSTDLIKASEYFALLFGTSGFKETEETIEAPPLEEQLLEGVKVDMAGAENEASEEGAGKDLVKASTGAETLAADADGSTAGTSAVEIEQAPEDSDDEDENTPEPSPSSTRIHRIVIRDVSYKTYRAALYWIATDQVSFSHLSSLYPSGRPPPSPASTASVSPSIPTASPKSLYRLSLFLSLPALSSLAFSSLESQLCASNCLAELLSDLAADFDEVKEVCMASVLKHWPAVVENGEIEELGRRVVEGELEGRKARIAWELMARLKPA
ncbi:hypothetical protein JCM6882_005363 [Rhodosporidiobolus microsporus]